jgi:predicted PurR-regulated permease PerM
VNNRISHAIAIAIQVTFIFVFLTIFFFVYVQGVEREEFRTQLNLIVDDITQEVMNDLPNLISKQSLVSPENMAILLDGIISVIQAKIANGSKNAISDIAEKNYKVRMLALKSLSGVIGLVVAAAIVILVTGFCLPIVTQVQDAMLVVIFIGLTELAFLQIIAKNYISADPNRVKRSLAQAVQRWIAQKSK